MELVSIIIPTYNRSKLLKNAINSIINQTYQNFEIIIIDDCSTDDTLKVVKNFEDKRIKYLKNKVSLRATGSRNRGIENSNGDFIAFLDDDDEWYPQKLEMQLEKFKDSKVGLVYGAIDLYFEALDFKYPTTPSKKGKLFKELLMKNHVGGTPSVMLRKAALGDNFFDVKFPAREEYDLWIKISKEWKIDYIKQPFVKAYYRNDIERISTNLENYIIGIEQLNLKYKKEIDETLTLEEKRKRKAQQNFFLGAQAVKMYDTKTARKYFYKSFKIDRNKNSIMAYTLSFFGPLALIKAKYLLSKIKG